MNKFFTSFLLLMSFALSAQIDSDNDYTGAWNDLGSWDEGVTTTRPTADDANDGEVSSDATNIDIILNGYITRNGGLLFATDGDPADQILINDTLVVLGDLTFQNNSRELRVPSGGVLLVFGDLLLDNKAVIDNGGVVYVQGTTTLSKKQTEYVDGGGSFYSDTDPAVVGKSDDLGALQADVSPVDALNNTGDPGEQSLWDFIQGNGVGLLPVELLDFSTVNKPYSVDLVWSTASESNTSHFEIYKSSNGEEFFLAGKVNAVGNSSTTQHYSYNDKAPFSGYNFYKLKSVDFDGYTEVFDVILNEFQFEGLQPYPNPFDGTKLNLSSFKEIGALDIMITDIGGRVVYQGRLEDENQVIEMNPVLEKGIYFIKIRNEQRNYNYSTRLIVR